MWCTLTVGGIRRSRTRRPIAPSASGRRKMFWCTNSFAAVRWRRKSNLCTRTFFVCPMRKAKNVLVHKFVCRGTVEEKIDKLIESKQQLSKDLLDGGADLVLTEMKDDELLQLVALDLKSAQTEA